jgi:hypothetical protein
MVVLREEKDNTVECFYKSSNILSSLYKKDKNELTIIFKGGRSYTYSDVDIKKYTRFEISESQGSVFSKHIKNLPTVRNVDVNINEINEKISTLLNEQKNNQHE